MKKRSKILLAVLALVVVVGGAIIFTQGKYLQGNLVSSTTGLTPSINTYVSGLRTYTKLTWNRYTGLGNYNAYVIFYKFGGVDFLPGDIESKLTPSIVLFNNPTEYKYSNLVKSGKYAFKVCVGNFDVKTQALKDWGNCSDTKFWKQPASL